MNKINISIWGRDFELGLEYDCYSNEGILPTQEKAVEMIIANKKCIEDSLTAVKNYCMKNNNGELKEKVINNIFKYVIPKYLYVKRDDNKRVVAIMCNYKFDMENGIAIVFENEGFVTIGKQDIIL